MKIAILGPINTQILSSVIKKKDIKNLPKGNGASLVPNIILGLLALGHHVTCISLTTEITDKIVFYKNKRLKIYYCPLRKRAFRFSDGKIGRASNFWYQEIKFMKQAILKDKPDIINAHWIYEYAYAAILSKKKYLITTHDIPHVILKYQTDLYRFVRFIMGFITLKIAKNISAASNYAKIQTEKYTNTSIDVIPNCLRKEEFLLKIKKKKLNKKIKIVMINQGFSDRKNVKIALQAFKEFNKNFPSSNLTLYGDDMERNNVCHQWAKKNNLTKNVIFVGFVPHAHLDKNLSKYDILLHTSLEETFGMIFIESMIRGVPIIACNNGGAAPGIVKGNGLLVDVTNIKKITDGLNKYATNPQLWSKIRIKAYKNVKKKYSQKNVATKYLSLYKKILMK
jgi:glycosyltransferase involved in cell wall biosynthesis|tara:strand:- start:39 stop:1226 length:1188 start_codon:yes stop_codon:yes gene_type:complete